MEGLRTRDCRFLVRLSYRHKEEWGVVTNPSQSVLNSHDLFTYLLFNFWDYRMLHRQKYLRDRRSRNPK